MVSPGKSLALSLSCSVSAMPVETAFFGVQPIKSSSFGTQESVQANEGIYLEIHIRVSMIGNGSDGLCVRVRVPKLTSQIVFQMHSGYHRRWHEKARK